MATPPNSPLSIMSNGIRIAYQMRGRGDPLVLIMGLGADGPVWEKHAAAYEQHFTCYLVDNRGAGASDKPPGPYTTAMMADDYAGLIRGLGLKRVRVAGISMGGAIAQQLAVRHPDLVRSMVLACTWARCDAYAAWVFDHFAAIRAQVPAGEFMRLLQLWIWSPGFVSSHHAELVEVQAEAAKGTPMPQHAFLAQCQACTGHDTREQLASIRTPTLITVGDRDIFTPMEHSQQLHAGISSARLEVFPGTGHAHHWEALDAFNASTTRWLLAN
jgi:pimeloyl-ACP methyl ester carboxylesterase